MISKTNILDLKLRQDIYQFISENPGLNISEISKKTNIPRSTLRYHLKHLIKLNIITVKIDRKNKRLYSCDLIGTRDKDLLSLLRQEIPFKIIMNLFFPGYCSKIELAKDLKLHPSTIHFHINKMLNMDIIKPIKVKDGRFISFKKNKTIFYKKPVGREIFYMWKNHDIFLNVYRLLITHKESMLDPSIIDTYYDFVREWKRMLGHKKYKKVFSFNSTINNIINILEEIGHFPFHF